MMIFRVLHFQIHCDSKALIDFGRFVLEKLEEIERYKQQ